MVNGGYAYGNLFMAQSPAAEKVFYDLLSIVRPTRILEIGSMHGGLTLMLRNILDDINLLDSIIRTYDIHEQEFLKPLVINRKVEVLTKNLFKSNYSNFNNTKDKDELLDFINQDGITMVLCDGGCKKCEFKLIAPLLKINDIIMAHDYAPDTIFFNTYMKNIVWDWLEIQDSDISDTVEINNLDPYYQDITQRAAWVCKIKRG